MMSDSGVLVFASIKIDDNTKITYHTYPDGLLEFSIGDGEFDLLATESGLHNLVTRAEEALRAVRRAITQNDGASPTE